MQAYSRRNKFQKDEPKGPAEEELIRAAELLESVEEELTMDDYVEMAHRRLQELMDNARDRVILGRYFIAHKDIARQFVIETEDAQHIMITLELPQAKKFYAKLSE